MERLEQRIVLHQPHDPVSLVAVSPAFEADGEVFVVTEGQQLMKSVDGGRTYFLPADPIVTKPVTAIRVSPAYGNDRVVFAGTETEGVYKSTDGGESWAVSTTGIVDLHITAIGFSPNFASDQTVFAGTNNGDLYRSVNGGSQWQEVGTGGVGAVTDIEVSPGYAADQTLLVTRFGGGVQRSTNGGANFAPINTGLVNLQVTSLALSQSFVSNPLALVGTDGGGVFVTFNGGITWAAANTGLSELQISDVEITPTGLGVVVADNAGVHVRSMTDPAWTAVNSGIVEFDQAGDHNYFDIAISPSFATDNTAFVATFGGLYRTHQPAPQWVEANITPYRFNREVQISPAFAADQTIFAGTYGGGLMKSTDAGGEWTVLSQGMANVYIDSIALSPDYLTDQTIFSGNFLGVFKSTNGGVTWTVSKLVPGAAQEVYARDVEVSPNFTNDQTVIATAHDIAQFAGVYLSTNGGVTWTKSVTGLPTNPEVDQVEFSPNFAVDNTVFVGVRGFGVYKSVDGGVTWSPANSGLPAAAVSRLRVSPTFAVDQTIFIVSAGGLFRTTDAGASWEEVDTGLPGVTAVAVSPNYATDQTVWIGAGPYGVYRSTDGGETWNGGSSGLERSEVRDIVVSPDYANDGTLIVGTSQGAYKSTDAGDNFVYIQTLNRYENERDLMYFTGSWQQSQNPQFSGRGMHSSTQAGATVEFQFFGSEITWIGSKGPDHGRARVTLDGQVVGVVDLYDPVAQAGVVIGQASLASGLHTVVIEVLGTRNPSSTGNLVTVDAFDVIEEVTGSLQSAVSPVLASSEASTAASFNAGTDLTSDSLWGPKFDPPVSAGHTLLDHVDLRQVVQAVTRPMHDHIEMPPTVPPDAKAHERLQEVFDRLQDIWSRIPHDFSGNLEIWERIIDRHRQHHGRFPR